MSASEADLDWLIARFDGLMGEWLDAAPERETGLKDWRFRIAEYSIHEFGAQTRLSLVIAAADQTERFGTLTEFAHGSGSDFRSACDFALQSWMRVDLPVIADAHASEPKICEDIRLERKGEPARILRIGPMQLTSFDGREPCCNTCITVQALRASGQRLFGQEIQYIKFVVARQESGETSADARLNGEQDDAIAAALCDWAASWENPGFEMRKQAVLCWTQSE